MSDPREFSATSDARERIAQVRTAYRLLHAYHRRLFDLLAMTREAVEERFGELSFESWGPTKTQRVPGGTTDPTDRWALDFSPLQQAYFAWVSTTKPSRGGFRLACWHTADKAYDKTFKKEPDPAELPAVGVSRTVLGFYLLVLGSEEHGLSDWDAVENAAGQGEGFDETYWLDGAVHVVSTNGVTIRLGGFEVDVAEAASKDALRVNVIDPLLALLAKATVVEMGS